MGLGLPKAYATNESKVDLQDNLVVLDGKIRDIYASPLGEDYILVSVDRLTLGESKKDDATDVDVLYDYKLRVYDLEMEQEGDYDVTIYGSEVDRMIKEIDRCINNS